MNRKEAAELLPIIQAFAEGKDIEYRTKGFNEDWKKVTQIPALSFKSFEYRIKPESKYRPFANAEECWQEMQKHQPFGWVRSKDDGSRALITLMISERDISINSISGLTMYELMEKFTFDDGAVFGILKEE